MKLIYALSVFALAASTSACSPTQFASMNEAASLKAGGAIDGVTPSRGGEAGEQAEDEAGEQAAGDKEGGNPPEAQIPQSFSPGLCANNPSIDRWGPAEGPADLEVAPLEISVLNNRMIRETSGRVRVLFQFKNELGRVAKIRAAAWCQGMDMPSMGLSQKTTITLQPLEVRQFEMYYPGTLDSSVSKFDLCYFTFENAFRVDGVKCNGPIE